MFQLQNQHTARRSEHSIFKDIWKKNLANQEEKFGIYTMIHLYSAINKHYSLAYMDSFMYQLYSGMTLEMWHGIVVESM